MPNSNTTRNPLSLVMAQGVPDLYTILLVSLFMETTKLPNISSSLPCLGRSHYPNSEGKLREIP